MATDQERRQSEQIEARMMRANGTDLYCEMRGSGPPVLFIPPGTGDAGIVEQVARQLADEFSVVSYDRRGNSRSPAPPGWKTTSIAEQAEDAEGLLDVLGLGTVAVFGSSGSGPIALELILRHPERVRSAILHDPALVFLVRDADLRRALVATPSSVTEAMQTRGPEAAYELRLRMMLTDPVWETVDPPLKQRMIRNGRVFYFVDMDAWARYRADEAAIAGIRCPVCLLRSEVSNAGYDAIRSRLASLLSDVTIATVSGARTHVPYLECPEAMATAMREYLRERSVMG